VGDLDADALRDPSGHGERAGRGVGDTVGQLDPASKVDRPQYSEIQEAQGAQAGLDLLDRREQHLVVAFDVSDAQPRRLPGSR
jgi:hypothetical protein